MPINVAMAARMNSAVRLPMLTRFEVKQLGSAVSLTTSTINGDCSARLASSSLSFQISCRLRWISTPSWRRNFKNFTGCIVYPPPALPPGRPPAGG